MSAQRLLCPRCRIDVEVDSSADCRCPVCGCDLALEPTRVWQPPGPPGSATTPEAHGTCTGRTVEEQARPPSPADGGCPSIPGYEILSELGRGGMGVVYKARHQQLRHLVAVKMPLVPVGADLSFRERFLREARAAAGLRHPNICPIHHVDQHEGRPFLVMPYIEGQNLRAWMEQKQPSARACAELVARLARALEYAHQHGVIHRDIKPQNTMIDAESGEPILMDFGLAKQLGEEDGQVTHSGQVLGTPAYMAPEQAAGRVHQIGPLADVYSLGALLYHLLCKQPPFAGSVGEILHRVQAEEPIPPRKLVPTVHRDLETICLKAMAKEPRSRYASAGELAADLERFAAGEAILARREGFLARLRRSARRNPVVVAAGVLLLIGAAVASSIIWRVSSRNDAIRKEKVELGSLLDEQDWSDARIEAIEKRLEQLERLSPRDAHDIRALLHQTIFNWALTPLEAKQGRLLDEHKDRVKRALALLKPRNEQLASKLEERYDHRLRLPELVLDLKPPFEHLREVFPNAGVEQRDDVLVCSGSGLTAVASSSAMHLTATFAPNWEQARSLGLRLNVRRQDRREFGYSFLLQPPKPSGQSTPMTFAEARAADEPVILQIVRNGRTLRQRTLSLRHLPTGELTLEAQRDQDRLTFRVSGVKEPLECRDLFPLSAAGVCGLHWPSEAVLRSLSGVRRTLAQNASPLEIGDDLYLRDRPAEALDFYRQQVRISPTGSVSREARLKEGVALLTLNRLEEASTVLTSLIDDTEDVWRDMAALHLWLTLIRQNRSTEAELVLDRLLRRDERTRLQILSYFPEVYSAEVLQFYRQRCVGLNYYRHDPERVQKIERVMQVEELLAESLDVILLTYQSRIRAYRLEGRNDEAIEGALEILRRLPKGHPCWMLVGETSWLLRERKQYAEALELLTRYLAERTVARPVVDPLLPERARVQAAMGDLHGAEQSLTKFLTSPSAAEVGSFSLVEAWFMLGFLREGRGDAAGALEAWKKAHERLHHDLFDGRGDSLTGIRFMNYLITGELSGLLTDENVRKVVDRMLVRYGNESLVHLLRSSGIVHPTILRDCWKTRRGKLWARKLAFQDVSFPQFVQVPPMLFGLEMARRDAFGGTMTPEQEELVWKIGEEGMQGVISGKIKEGVVFGLAATWKGVTNFLGWGGVRGTFAPSLRGPLAYVMGHRYLRRNNPTEARTFFEQARTDAPPGSTLQRLAQAELDRPRMK